MAFDRNPPPAAVPRHVAIIMDGNGRWAERRGLPRVAGHRAGLKSVRACVEHCTRRGVEALTLFAFSSENWRRPPQEVGFLMQLFLDSIDREVDELAANRVELRFVGDRAALAAELRDRMARAEARTRGGTGLKLVVAVAYGGRWDIVAAARRLAADCASGALDPAAIDEERFGAALAIGDLPDPDLFVRTGGEHRVSNFLLWSLAYTEFWFTDTLWPEFGAAELDRAFADYARRERRFGLTGAQLGTGAC